MASTRLHSLRSALVISTLMLSLLGSRALARPLFKTSAAGQPDTLEVFAMYVEFTDETVANNETGTTGTGIFGSDNDTSYTLDPNGRSVRTDTAYLAKHFEFARNYFDKVSGGKVVVLPRFFPKPDGAGHVTPVKLTKRMKSYNPAIEDKSKKQKTTDFEAQRAQALMTFVSESASLFEGFVGPDTLSNPFRVAFSEARQNPSSHRYRAFMIFHAGHSRLIDGGTLGFAGANTPNDFTDFFVTKGDFRNLDSATDNNLPSGKAVPERRRDSLGAVVNSGRDTVTEFMMLSEAASQDKANWGINGILVNQLARQMGMPDVFDVVQGISQLGYFDVMDFAGYNTLSGFLPVFPSAWIRAYMGWDAPVEVPRGAGASSQMTLYAADQPGAGRTRTAKVSLNEREYLLIENRQRASRDSTVTVYYSKQNNATDYKFSIKDSVRVPYAALDSIFADSTCKTWDNGSCKTKQPNPYKPKGRGIITGANHYDVGLPGSGMLVWHVNEWFLETFLKAGVVNAYLGDTLKSQYKGLELVEADGIPSIGKQFKDPLGQPAFDYGTPQDMLPNIFRRRTNPPKDTSWRPTPETLSVIGSYGFANTNSWNDGRTHIKLEGLLPAQPLVARAIGGFTGDSVFTFRDSALTLRVWWPNDSSVARPAGSLWPARTAPSGLPQAVNVLQAANGSGPYVVSVSDTGLLQTYAVDGKLALATRDTVRDAGRYDSVEALLPSGNTRPQNAAPVNSFANPDGAPVGACVAKDSIFVVLTSRSLRFIRPNPDSLNGTARSGGQVTTIPVRGMVGPMAWGGKVFVVDSSRVFRGFNLNGTPDDSVSLPAGSYHAMAGLLFGATKDSQIVITGTGGTALLVNVSMRYGYVDMHPVWGDTVRSKEHFSVSVSDFDRDGEDDVLLLGSLGDALLMHARLDKQGQAFLGFPQRFLRSVELLDTAQKVYTTEDRSPPALADLNGDGHPDILFSGSNRVYAIDWHGAWLPGWPFLPQPHQSVRFFSYPGDTRYPETVIGASPVVVSLHQSPTVLLGTPDGLIYAINSSGKKLGYSSFTSDQQNGTGVLMTDRSDWPLSVGGLSADSLRSPYIHLTLAQVDSSRSGDLELLAQTASGSLNVWTLRGSLAKAGQNWLTSGGDARRSFRLEAAILSAPAAAGATSTIQEFHLFPSPVRHGVATVHLKIGAAATKARVQVFSLSGHPVKEESFSGLTEGLQPFNHVLDLSHLGPDVYTALCEVWFPDGTKSSKWERFGVVK
jgi:hypothetical protein